LNTIDNRWMSTPGDAGRYRKRVAVAIGCEHNVVDESHNKLFTTIRV
jgi:hypothetical protein